MSFGNNCYKQSKIEKLISYICDCEYEYFLNKANVLGIGLGYKVKNGFRTNQLCIQVFVTEKFSREQLPPEDLVPAIYKGIPTDVNKTGQFTICSFTQKIVPAIGGYVIGIDYKNIGAGTLGCLVTDGKDLFILGNNHGLAASNEAPLGTKIMQPSSKYGGDVNKDTIATLSKFVPVKFKETFKRPTNYTDCAIGKVINKSLVSPKIALVGMPDGIIVPKLNQKVKKVGFKTELTTGEIITINGTIEIQFNSEKTAIFKKVILTNKMSEKGDSGALLFNDNNNYVVGLLMGDNEDSTIFNPINMVLEQLDVKLVTKNL
ncbi:hypothetical protein [Clostridium botulinum]|uniref:Nal1 N-terminal domain-containing protein n=1 Tax=Clostridium botulinum TaxID=1491 RepID=A0A9Q1UWY8_CLOBO|nr:hypothetical protein [Clostridium botulinum]AEB77494.1 conserved hypothetical protein [Clostridium botulinum BKT015925]KEH96078.1 hypothetical protein Y848_p0071 [Clostridium botulinum C/D str. Sp77]KEH96888.1 hypothetical protein Z953_13580 [Clostridium botulinum D str. 16868]KLU74654.1 hypothetical protein CBC3_13235 [Clostridium botulinum V891]KOA75835.1 hypothetical protein ADU77_10540 [Clostridium botulinum]